MRGQFTLAYFIIAILLAKSEAGTAQNVRFDNIPRHLQFMARDAQDSSLISVSGNVQTPGFDSLYLVLYQSVGGVTRRIGSTGSGKLNYVGGAAPFVLQKKIHAELAEYKIEVMAAPQGVPPAGHILLRTVDSLVSGDVFLIAGQSNSHPADTLATYKDEYCRTFGIQTPGENYSGYNPADTLWGYANGHGFGGTFTGPYLVGVWGIRLMQYVRDSFRIPVCIINGGAGGSSIQMNLPSAVHTDLSSIYGRLLYRVQKAGLQNAIRAIFWYQGESDIPTDTAVYFQRFSTLRAAWQTDYTGFSKIYLSQIHPGCPYPGGGLIREFQRTINRRYPEIQPMSTLTLPEHDGCHYSKKGYDMFAYQAFRLVARDFYGSTNNAEIETPDILHAYYPGRNKNTIRLLFDKSSALSLTSIPGRNISDYFYLDSDTGRVRQTEANGNMVTLRLRDTVTAGRLTYLPDNYYNYSDSYYQGPFIVNGNGIGAFSFHGKAIENYTAFKAAEANFGYEQRLAVSENPIPLVDSSLEWPESYRWSAPGGRLSSDTVANPTVIFSSAGAFPVTLTVANKFGTNTITKTINVFANQVLPVNLIAFHAREKDCEAQLDWETAQEINVRAFEVQQSADGVKFKTVSSVAPNGNLYSVTLPQSEANNYYRLKIIDNDGRFSYSSVQNLKLACDLRKEYLSVSPNPVRSGSLTSITYRSTNDKGRGTLRLLNASGKEISRVLVTVRKGVNKYSFPMTGVHAGFYYIRLDAAGADVRVEKVVVGN